MQAIILLISYFREIAAAGIGAFSLAILVMVGRWRGRFNRLEQQKNELALAVMLRTREIRREKETIQRQKQQIEQLLEKAQQSNRAKDEFLANISHEIRTPLHGVIGMTALALHTELTAEQREYLELTGASAQSLLALVNDVLDFSKIEAGGLTLECLPFSVRDCVKAAVGAFPVSAKKRGLEFNWNVAPDVPETIDGDGLRLRQILVNLLGNAFKFTHEGSIQLDALVEELSAKSADTGNCKGWICFCVRDTGIGVPKDKLQAIFEPFRQADGSTTRKYGGSGLGLSICLQLAHRMGGELALESEEGGGATFTLRVPLACSAPCDILAESGLAKNFP